MPVVSKRPISASGVKVSSIRETLASLTFSFGNSKIIDHSSRGWSCCVSVVVLVGNFFLVILGCKLDVGLNNLLVMLREIS